MATGENVLSMLLPDGGWAITGDSFEGITFIDCDPITKKQFTDGFAKYESWKLAQDALKVDSRKAILDRLGLTADEAAILLG